MPWIPGVVIGHRVERFHVGMEVDLYDVQTSYPQKWVETYIPFVGELRDGVHFTPSDNAQDMMDRVTDMVSTQECSCYVFVGTHSLLFNVYRRRCLLVSMFRPLTDRERLHLGHLQLLWYV